MHLTSKGLLPNTSGANFFVLLGQHLCILLTVRNALNKQLFFKTGIQVQNHIQDLSFSI